MRRQGKRVAALVAMTAGLLIPATTAVADPGPGFGEHVVACQQEMGFSGTHNPGMHHGSAGWDGMSCDC